MPEDQENPDFKYIVRIANTDLDGKYHVIPAIARVKGLGIRTAAIVARQAGIDPYKKIGNATDDEVTALATAVDSIQGALPVWMLNRRMDIDTGEDLHLLTTDLDQKKRDDYNRLGKIRSYRGIRLQDGNKVRGQRSRSNGRTGLTLGVSRKKD